MGEPAIGSLPADNGRSVAAIVLAAGLSRRMAPHNKLLTRDSAGRSMVAHVVSACRASRAGRVIVVTGHQSGQVQAAVREACPADAIDFVHAASFAEGLSASLQAGLQALPDPIAAALVCLGDMPLVRAGLLDRMIAAFDPARGRCAVVPVWQGRRGNPVLWGRRFFADICRLSGDAGARSLLTTHAPLVAAVASDGPEIFADFDTPEAVTGSVFAPAGRGGSAFQTP